MKLKRFKWLLPHLNTIFTLPNYARLIRAQASAESFDVRKDTVSRTTIFSSYRDSQNLVRNGKVRVLALKSDKEVK